MIAFIIREKNNRWRNFVQGMVGLKDQVFFLSEVIVMEVYEETATRKKCENGTEKRVNMERQIRNHNKLRDSEQVLLEAMVILYEGNMHIKNFMFNESMTKLNWPSKQLKNELSFLSSGEQVLARIGLDIWDGSGGIFFNELYQELDYRNFEKIINLLIFLRDPNK